MIARDDTNKKCRVRIAHAAFRLRMKRVRSAHPTTVRTPSCSPRPSPAPIHAAFKPIGKTNGSGVISRRAASDNKKIHGASAFPGRRDFTTVTA